MLMEEIGCVILSKVNIHVVYCYILDCMYLIQIISFVTAFAFCHDFSFSVRLEYKLFVK